MLNDSVARPASAYVKVARVRFVNANLLGGGNYCARVAGFDEDAATDDGGNNDGAANEVEHAYGC